MKTVTATNARRQWSETLRLSGEAPLRITSNGKIKAVMLSTDQYKKLLTAQDLPSSKN